MTEIYWLYHYKIFQDDDELEVVSDDDDRNEKLIGIFSSRKKTEEAIDHLRKQQGFRDWPGGFRILEGELDTYAWEDGFISWDEAHGDGT